MTFCLAMKIEDGLVGIADTRVTTGVEQITARKVTIHQHGNHSMFLMTSGLRSLRDKALTYYSEMLEQNDESFDKLYKAVNAYAAQLRRVIREDRKALTESGLSLNLFSIIGGQLEKDSEHKLYMLYPQANWVEVSEGTPYYIIGESSYGKPLLDRVLTYHSSIQTALKVGYLAFDSTRISATDVDFPLDVVVYQKNTFSVVHHRFTQENMQLLAEWWQKRMRSSLEEFPSEWLAPLLAKLPKP
ncbi:MAG: peptidase [Nitrospinota bacterium]|nr:peptidase [Nitrospinota bacterium]